MELRDSIELMISTSYRSRFLAEYIQLKLRTEKLSKLIGDYDSGELDFIPETPIELLRDQAESMESYLSILKKRAIIENIKLPD